MAVRVFGGQPLDQWAGQLSSTGTTNEVTLATVVIPAGLLGKNGQLEVQTLWKYTNNANTKTLRVRFGGTSILVISATATQTQQAHARVANANSESSQVCFSPTNTSGFAATSADVTTMSVDTAQAVSLTFTAQLANAADTIELRSYIVRVFPKG